MPTIHNGEEWYTLREIAALWGIDVQRIYPAVLTLRRIGAIRLLEDPADERTKLVHADSIPTIAKALRYNVDSDNASASA